MSTEENINDNEEVMVVADENTAEIDSSGPSSSGGSHSIQVSRINANRGSSSGFTMPKDPRLDTNRRDAHGNIRQLFAAITKSHETRSTGNLLTSSRIEDRNTNKRRRTNSGSSNENVDNFEIMENLLANWSNLDKLKFKKKSEIICVCKHAHCVLCLETPPEREFGNVYCDCECDSCLWKNPGLTGKKFANLIDSFGKMSFFPKQTNKKSCETQVDDHNLQLAIPKIQKSGLNSTQEIEEWYKANNLKRGFNYAPSFWACPCKMHKLVIAKKNEKVLVAKGNSTWEISGINKKWSLFDFPEESFYYIGEEPSPVEGRRSKSENRQGSSNEGSFIDIEQKMKRLEDEVASLRRGNQNEQQPRNNNNFENRDTRESRLQLNRNYFDGRRGTYFPRGRGGSNIERGNIGPRRGYRR